MLSRRLLSGFGTRRCLISLLTIDHLQSNANTAGQAVMQRTAMTGIVHKGGEMAMRNRDWVHSDEAGAHLLYLRLLARSFATRNALARCIAEGPYRCTIMAARAISAAIAARWRGFSKN